jgi:hypothetical protein
MGTVTDGVDERVLVGRNETAAGRVDPGGIPGDVRATQPTPPVSSAARDHGGSPPNTAVSSLVVAKDAASPARFAASPGPQAAEQWEGAPLPRTLRTFVAHHRTGAARANRECV